MKIVFTANIKENLYNPIVEGFSSAAHVCGFNVIKWDESMKPAWDMAYETSPDIVVCYKKASSALTNTSEEYGFKIVVINPEEVDSRPITAYLHRPAANLVRYRPSKKLNDIIAISERQTPELIHLQQLGLKCFSLKHNLGVPHYLGRLNPEQVPKEISKSKVYIETNGDTETMMNSICCGTLPVSLGMGISEEKTIENIAEMKSYVKTMLSNEKQRLSAIQQTYQRVIENDTYFHRLRDIMTLTDNEKEASLCLEKLGELV